MLIVNQLISVRRKGNQINIVLDKILGGGLIVMWCKILVIDAFSYFNKSIILWQIIFSKFRVSIKSSIKSVNIKLIVVTFLLTLNISVLKVK